MKLFHKPRFLWLFGIFLLWLAIHYWDALLSVLGAAARAAGFSAVKSHMSPIF